MGFKKFSTLGSGGHSVYRSRTILAILVGSYLGNIPVKFKLHWPKGSGGSRLKKQIIHIFFIFSSGGNFVHQRETVLAILAEGHLSNIPMKFE